jgi:hypothetical protein
MAQSDHVIRNQAAIITGVSILDIGWVESHVRWGCRISYGCFGFHVVIVEADQTG